MNQRLKIWIYLMNHKMSHLIMTILMLIRQIMNKEITLCFKVLVMKKKLMNSEYLLNVLMNSFLVKLMISLQFVMELAYFMLSFKAYFHQTTMKNLTSNLHPPNLAQKLFMFLKILFLYFYLEIMVIFQIKPNT